MLSRLPGTGFYFTYCGTPTEAILRFKFLNSIKSSLEFCICGNIITHFSIIISSISKHIKISCSGKSKHNSLFFSSLFYISLLHPELPGSHERFQAPEEFLPRGKHLSRLKNRSLFKHHNIFLPISRHLHRQQPLLQPDEAVWS